MDVIIYLAMLSTYPCYLLGSGRLHWKNMGKHTETVVHYECDRCGHQTTTPNDRGGCADVTLDITTVAYNGDVGGATLRKWLCGSCAKAMQDFLSGTAMVTEGGGDVR